MKNKIKTILGFIAMVPILGITILYQMFIGEKGFADCDNKSCKTCRATKCPFHFKNRNEYLNGKYALH